MSEYQPVPNVASSMSAPLRSGILQRKCSCGGSGGGCSECEKKRERLQRRASRNATPDAAPSVVHQVLNSPGQPLDSTTRSFMEPRFGHDFSQVRVHSDAHAGRSANEVNALAYTVGNHIVFSPGQYQPAGSTGRQILAHELTHVVQQRSNVNAPSLDKLSIDPSDSPLEAEAARVEKSILSSEPTPGSLSIQSALPRISRADPQAISLTTNLGNTVGAGIQFLPANVTDTRVGPVSVRSGLLGDRASRLNVIIGANMTLRTLARQLLPLWTTATPFTPPGAAAPLPLDIITEDELAQGLLVYNDTYLPVPSMSKWKAGLRFPLPVEIDEATGVATLHPLQIKALAGAFDPAWAPLIEQHATATAAPPAATLQADATAFLASETTALGRGIHLGARALTNAVAELPFIQEVFRQLGAGGFDVALSFMDNLVNREITILASQRDGAAILTQIRTALAAAPAAPTADQQASLTRANHMLGLVAGTAAVAPPAATRSRAEKTVTIDTVKLDGSTQTPSTDVAIANAIFSQCNVRLVHNHDETATNAETTGWLGGNTDLRASPSCGTATAEERGLYAGATTRFGLNARIRVFYPATFTGLSARGYSLNPGCATGAAAAIREMAVVQNSGTERTLAHELGHILLDTVAHRTGTTNVMVPTATAPLAETLTDTQCTTVYRNA